MADKVIALACAAGMSTSLLVSKMQKAAADNGKDYEIFAKSTADIDNMLAGTGSVSYTHLFGEYSRRLYD